MKIALQIYYCVLSGALAGLIAWLLVGAAGAAHWSSLALSVCVVGGGLGAAMMAALTLTRGCVERWSPQRMALLLLPDAGIGVVAGVSGLGIGQGVFLLVGGEWAGRVAGWTSLNLLLGLGQALRGGSPKRFAVGAAAGVVAGVACGLTYEAITQSFLAHSDEAQMWASCLGLMAVGAAFAGCIPTAESLASSAVVVVRSGRNAGLEFVLLDRLTVGSSERCRVMIPDDPAVEAEHVDLLVADGGIEIHNRGRSHVTVNDQVVAPDGRLRCPPRATLRIGASELRIL